MTDTRGFGRSEMFIGHVPSDEGEGDTVNDQTAKGPSGELDHPELGRTATRQCVESRPPNPGRTDCCGKPSDSPHGLGICRGPRWIGRLRGTPESVDGGDRG